jgi:hypothetical protein
MSGEAWAELGAAVSAIREQLQQAMDDGAGQRLKFDVGPVELEFAVEVRAEGKGRVKVFVLPWTVEAGAGGVRDRTQRIKLTLQPVDECGEDAKIADPSERRPS